MMTLKSSLLAAASLATVWYGCSVCAGEAPDATTPKGAEMPLAEYLERAGVNADCYFTVEAIGERNDALNILRKKVMLDPEARTGDEIVRAIERAVPGVRVMRDGANGVVYHVQGSPEKKMDGYWLDQKVAFDFSGRLGNVFPALQKACNGAVDFEHGGLMGSTPLPEGPCRIACATAPESAREAITYGLALSQRERMLWTCSTRGIKPQTAYLLFGPRVSQVRHELEDANVPFSRGEEAYWKNPKSMEAVTAAAAYITDHAGRPPGLQVRWAMLYLGRVRAVSEMPVLFNYLTYQYSPRGLIEERYPAVRALAMMGKAACDEAIRQMVVEQDPARLALLWHVLIGVVGRRDAAKLLEEGVLPAMNEQRRGMIKAAETHPGPTTLPDTGD